MKRRGSALVYVIIVVFSITSVVIVGAKMSSASENEFQSAVKEAQFKSMADGAVAEVIADSYRRTMATGSKTTNFTLANLTTNTIDDPTINRAYRLTITGTIGDRTYTSTRVIGMREQPNPAFYGLWVKSAYSDSLLGTTVNGSVYFAAGATLSGVWNVSEDFLIRGAATISLGTTVGGTQITGVRDQTMPAFDQVNYTPQASVLLSKNNESDFTFAGVDAQGKYPVHLRNGNFTMNGGTISGRGTLFVQGNLTINGNYNYADASSRILVLVTGRLIINAVATQIVGNYMVMNRIDLSGVALTIPRGSLGTNAAFNRLSAAVNITQDDTFLEDPDARVRHRLPGYFP